MFWRFGGYANISSLDTLLDRPDVTVEEVLEESDTIGELKGQNAKLIDFLREETVLEKLLAYTVASAKPPSPSSVSSTPEKSSAGGFLVKAMSRKGRSKSRGEQDEPDKAEKQRMKYAYISCEILSADVWSISESILESTDLLRPFWDFLKTDAPMDNLLAGYFTKINEALIEKQPARMVSFVRTLEDMIPNMMKHVDCPMIMDLLLKLISLEKDPGGQGIIDWIQSQNLIPTLLSFISPDHPAVIQTAAGDFLKAIITISANATGTDQTVIGPNELTRELVSEPCISKLLTEMLKGGNSLTVGVGIVIEVIRKNNSDYDAESQIGPEPKSSDPIYLGTLLRLFAHAVPKFMDILHSSKHTVMTEKGGKSIERAELKVAWGKKIEPLGFDRFKTCELMAELLHCSNMALLNERGLEDEVMKRDAEREKLKAEGRLAPSALEQNNGDEFGRSEDSSGFHHAEAFSSLGESPENIRHFDNQMQSNNNDEDGFEKVALDDIDAAMDDIDERTPTTEEPKPMEHEETTTLTEKIDDMNIDDDVGMTKVDAETSGEDIEQPLSMPTLHSRRHVDDYEYILINKPGHNPATEALIADVVTPAPLFARRTTSEPTADAPSPFTQANLSLGIEPGQNTEEESQLGGEEEAVPGPDIQTESDGTPVLGDLLKIQFVEHHVVPTILDFFFRFPWNNFLHNVVYDVVQQVFNGAMDRGYNRNVATDLFETGRITERVIEGQERSDQSQKDLKMRLGYMGHLTLIAEEIVKFTERQPPETLAAAILDKIMDPNWIHYVEHVLADTRERDNAILGGFRPDPTGGPRQAVLNAVNAGQNSFANAGSQALADAGLEGTQDAPLDSMDLAAAGAAPGYNLSNNNAMFSSDEEEEDDSEERRLNEHSVQGQIGELTAEPDEEQIDLDLDSTNASQVSEQSLPPAPLAVPAASSSARRRLAAILSQKKRQANNNPLAELDADEDDTTEGDTDNNGGSSIKPAPLRSLQKGRGRIVKKRRSKVRFGDEPELADATQQSSSRGGAGSSPNTADGSGFAEDFQGFGADDGKDQYENLADDSDDSSGHVDILSTLRKMSTRPLRGLQSAQLDGPDSSRGESENAIHEEYVEGSDDDNGGLAERLGPKAASTATARRPLFDDGDSDEEGSKVAPLTKLVSSSASAETTTTAPAAAAAPAVPETPEDPEAEHARKKKEEQQRLLEEWGLAGDDSSEDEDQPPITMKRRTSGGSTGSAGSAGSGSSSEKR